MSSERIDATAPAVLADLWLGFARAYDRCPAEVRTVQKFVTEHVGRIPKARDDAERWAHVGAAFQRILPLVVGSRECSRAVDRIVQEYGGLPSTPATRLKRSPEENSIGFAIAFGLGAGGVIVGVVCLVIWASS